MDVGSHIELKEVGDPRNRGEPSRTNISHLKGDDPEPGAPFMSVQSEPGWKVVGEGVRVVSPVQEEQVFPRLKEDWIPPGRTWDMSVRHAV